MADLDAIRNLMKKRKEMKSSFSSQRKTSSHATHNSLPDAELHYYQAKCYDNGLEGCEINDEKAMAEYLEAARLGNSKAMVVVASDYSDSEKSILGYDLSKAESWAKKALECENPDGYKVLFDLLENQGKGSEAIDQLEIGVSNGSLDCIEWLSFLLYWGGYVGDHIITEDVERSFDLLNSVKWDDEHSIALELLGNIYRDRSDYHNAKKYYEQSLNADDENYSAMANLGNLFRRDEIKDYDRAKSLLEVAAHHGNIAAMNTLGVMMYLGEGGEQDEHGAINWIKKAAQGGLHQAMINLYDILIEDNIGEAEYWLNRAAREGSEDAKERLAELQVEQNNYDTSRSDKIYDNQLSNLENTLSLSPYSTWGSGFPNRIEAIKKVIDNGELSDFEADRLRILMGWLSLVYFKEHFCDDNFDDYEQDYYDILDKIDDYVGGMSEISDEGAFLYYIANMYSAQRFKDIDPKDKLNELWTKLQTIELSQEATEFKVSFWKETAKDVYNIMSDLLDINNHTSNYSSPTTYTEDSIKDKVITIVADKMGLDEDEVHTYSRLETDLGADSLDAVELIMEMEKEFEMTIPDEDAVKIKTVGDIVTYIKLNI